MGKGEIARYEQFLLFLQCFQKVCFLGASKGVTVWEWVKGKNPYINIEVVVQTKPDRHLDRCTHAHTPKNCCGEYVLLTVDNASRLHKKYAEARDSRHRPGYTMLSCGSLALRRIFLPMAMIYSQHLFI